MYLILGKLLRLLWGEDPTPEDTHAPVAQGMTRLHLFSGQFADEDAAADYCYELTDDPAPFTLDLPETYLNSDQITMTFGEKERLREIHRYLTDRQRKKALRRTKGHNTLIIVPEAAFEGDDFRLYDTPRVIYLGAVTLPDDPNGKGDPL